jgi:hypothetical protein
LLHSRQGSIGSRARPRGLLRPFLFNSDPITSMWQKLKEQLPVIFVTAVLVIGAAVYILRDLAVRQQAEVAPLRLENEYLRAQADENRRQIEATTRLLKDVIAQQGVAVVRAEEQIAKINEERLTRLAEVIAQRVIPELPAPRPAEEIEHSQNQQVDRVASRLVENIRPVLAEAVADQKAAVAQLRQHNDTRVQQLNVGLMAAQAAAQDALQLSREISALYVESYKDDGVLMRLFSLPANLVIDAANLNFVSGDKTKALEVSRKIEELEKRLKEVQSLAGASGS